MSPDQELSIDRFVVIEPARRMHQYTYVNAELGPSMQTPVMWVCDGQVAFQSGDNVTDWHGSFDRTADGAITIKFNARGSQCPLKVTLLHYIGKAVGGAHTWSGFDYKSRRITLYKIGSSVWDAENDKWNLEELHM